MTLKSKLVFVFSIAILTGAVVSIFHRQESHGDPIKLSGTWIDQNGKEFSENRLKGRVTLMTLAYSTCRTLCPMIGARVKKLDDALAKHGHQTKIVLISIDPENETPESLSAWMKSRGVLKDHWSFIKGTPESTLGLAKQLRSEKLKMGFSDHASPDHIPHTSYLAVLGHNGEVREVVDLMQNDEALLASVENLLD